MNISEAIQSVKEGNFVSHHSFDYYESMHEYNGSFYYEDGANLSATNTIERLKWDKWSREGWFVKFSKEQIDREKLKEMHKSNKYMLQNNKSYEECVIRY